MNPGLLLSAFDSASANTPEPIALGASFFITVAPQYCTSDAGHTTPCTNGTSIAAWYEQVSKTWFTWSSYALGINPVFNVSGAVYNASFSSSGSFPFTGVWPQNDVTIVTRFTPQAFVGEILASGNDSGDQAYNFFRSGTTGTVRRHSTGPTGALTNTTDLTLSYTGTGIKPTSTEKMRISGGAWSTVSNVRPTRAGSSPNLILGAGPAGATQFTNFKGIALFPSVLTDPQITAVESYFNSL